MKLPLIIVNFKIYRESIGKNAYNLAKMIEHVAIERDSEIAIAPDFLDLVKIKDIVDIPVFAQHADAVELGGHTGHVTIEILKEYEIDGLIINHSEKRLNFADIEYLVTNSRNYGLISILCTNNIETTVAGAALKPDFLAIEPPELIGGDISVSKAKPEIIMNSVQQSKKINSAVKILAGAGIKDKLDSKKALELGADGVLIASGIVKSKDPIKSLNDIIDGFMEAKYGER